MDWSAYTLYRFDFINYDNQVDPLFLLAKEPLNINLVLEFRDTGDATEASVDDYWSGRKQPVKIKSLGQVEKKYWKRVLTLDLVDCDLEITVEKFLIQE